MASVRTAFFRDFDTGSAACKIGLILQGQDNIANSRLIDGIADGLKKISPDTVISQVFFSVIIIRVWKSFTE